MARRGLKIEMKDAVEAAHSWVLPGSYLELKV